MRTVPLPFIGGFYADESRPWSMQDCVNWLPTASEQPDSTRTMVMAKTPPGLSPYAKWDDGSELGTELGPVRGLHNAEGRLFTTIGGRFIQISNSGVMIPIGLVPGLTRTKHAHNQITGGNEIITVNGSSGYIYNTVTQVFEQITDEGYPGAIDALFMDGYFVQIDPTRRFAFNSDLSDGMAYNTLDRFTSEKSPDLLMALGSSQNDLILFSESTAEFFENTGAAQQPFRSKRISMERGCASRYGVAHLDNTVFWLGNDGKFYMLEGYGPRRISTRPIEQSILGLNWGLAYAFIWESAGHSVVYWTFPDGRTWGYDVSQPPGLQWHRRESLGFEVWRVTSTAFWQNKWIAGDFQNDHLWEMDWGYPMEYQSEFISEMVGAPIHDNQSLVKMPRLEFIFDTGQPEVEEREFPDQPLAPTITGTPVDGVAGEEYGPFTYTITAFGGDVATVVVRSGALPAGLTMDNEGTITGTPTESGSFTVTVRVTDVNGLFDDTTGTFAVTVAMFVAIDNILTLQKSSDGGDTFPDDITTGLTTPTATVCTAAAGGLVFIFGDGTEGRVSEDGATFDACTGLAATSAVNPGDGNLLRINGEWQLYHWGLHVSDDGTAWSERVISSGAIDAVQRPVARGTLVLGVADDNWLNVSVDAGVTFTEYQVSAFSATDGFQRLLAVGSTKFLAFGQDSSGDLLIGESTTGLTGSWTTAAGPATDLVHGVARDPVSERILIVLQTGATWYSDDDGDTWDAGMAVPYAGAAALPPLQANNMIYSNGAFFFAAEQAAGVNRIYRSVNGSDAWVSVFEADPTGNPIHSMCERQP